MMALPRTKSVLVESLYQQLPRLAFKRRWWQRIRLKPENEFGVVLYLEAQPWVRFLVGWCRNLPRVTVSARSIDLAPPKTPLLRCDQPYCVLVDHREDCWYFGSSWEAVSHVLRLNGR